MVIRALIVAALIVAVLVATRAYTRSHRRSVDPLSLPPFGNDVVHGNATWVVFTTEYCATCAPVKERIARLDPTADVVEIDVAERPDLANQYEVRTAPTVLFAGANGTVRARFVGNVPEAELMTARG